MRVHPSMVASLFLIVAGCGMPGSMNATDRDLHVADVELSSGAPEGALSIASALVSAHPNDAEALVRLGRAQQAMGQEEAATDSFARAVASDGSSFDALFGLARLHIHSDPARAVGELTRLSADHPGDARLRTDLGVAYDMLGQHAKAQSAYRQALSVSPSLVSAQVDLGLSLALSKKTDQSIGLLGPLANAQPDARIREDYALASAIAGHDEDARAVLSQELPGQDVSVAMAAYKQLGTMP